MLHLLYAIRSLVARKVVHEQADFGVKVGGSKLLQVLLELLTVN